MIPAESFDVDQQLAECAWDEVVVKPAVGCGGFDIHRRPRGEPATVAVAVDLAERGHVVVQAYAPQCTRPTPPSCGWRSARWPAPSDLV
ncbi:MAG: hypothetical protein ABI083_10005 [Lapillicoccus sp.]